MGIRKQKPTGGKEAFQSNFKFFDGGTLKILHLVETNIMLPYKIHDFIRTEFSNLADVSKFPFSFEKNENIALQ